jgi:hypothetical protein
VSDQLRQREPGPVAIRKGIESLISGLNARHPGQRWRVASPPHGLEGTGAVGTGHVDRARVVGPDDEDAVGNVSSPGSPANEDGPDHPREQVA